MTRISKRILSFDYTGNPQEIILAKGKYLFEAWGGSGQRTMCQLDFDPKGRGAYTSGIISLKKELKLFIYVGQSGLNQAPSFNGNKLGKGSESGGGATDFRLEKGSNWYTLSSLKSRIMVAAGGGGADCYPGGDAGALEGNQGTCPSTLTLPGVGTQTSGGKAGSGGFPGEFGVGGFGGCSNQDCDGAGGGGGGYYGGGGMIGTGGGSGGSSFISGYTGCDAIIEATGLPSGQPFHYSGYFFTKGVMRAGFEEMPSFNGSSKTKYGNIGNGYARITLLDMVMTCKRMIGNSIAKYSLLVLMMSY